ncbi:CheB methylesterase domain-containing protein [Paenibacillus koleovorans]|uniref:CheB methylesterase domain-containing protein n=1 Tax=Paenibacillus koleovorans TaxID=121608 RepID=UPI0027D8DD95|nr:CheB methylesterase domain-containing protein [Paenibacillus koleovorans]
MPPPRRLHGDTGSGLRTGQAAGDACSFDGKSTGTVSGCKVIAVGASTGGTEAITRLLGALPPAMPGIVIVQHIPPVFSRMFAERLNETTGFTVREAQSGDVVLPGHVLIAPGDQHMRLLQGRAGYEVECGAGVKVGGHRPSIDVLFDSVATVAGKASIGVLLTGMGADGAKGLLAMRRAGARTLGQDEASSVVYGMPKVAFELGAVERQVPLERMAAALIGLLAPGR